MRKSSASKKTTLLSPTALVLAALTAGGLMAFTYKSEDNFLSGNGEPADAISTNYAEILIHEHPEDNELRRKLIEALTELDEFEKAEQYIRDWPDPEGSEQQFYLLENHIIRAQQERQTKELESLSAELFKLDYKTLAPRQLKRFAHLALMRQNPALAAAVYLELSVREPDQASSYQDEAARWYLAGGQPHKASDIYFGLAEKSDSKEKKREYLHKAFIQMLASNRQQEAAGLTARQAPLFTDSEEDLHWLREGIQVSNATGRRDLSYAMLQRWKELTPESSEADKALLSAQLMFGDIDDAWKTGEVILSNEKGDPDLLNRMAKISEWTGHNNYALNYWIRSLEQHEDPEVREHSWKLALQLFDFDSSIPLLAGLKDRRRMTEDELHAYVYSCESKGVPEDAEAWLSDYVNRYPEHELGWRLLLQNLENTQQLNKKAITWRRFSEHFKLSPEDRISWAETEWKNYQPEIAWDVLKKTRQPQNSITDPEYWHLRASLAWTLEYDDLTISTYEAMYARKMHLSREEETQYLDLMANRNKRQALELALNMWNKSQNPDRLILSLQLAEDLHDWDLSRKLLQEAGNTPAVADLPYVLASRGAFAVHSNQLAEAESFYRRGIRLYPEDNLFRERLLWLYISQDRKETIAFLLKQWHQQAMNDHSLWLAFASANQILNRSSTALAWYQKYLRENPEDWNILVAFADTLEAAGYDEEALRLRTQLVSTFGHQPALLRKESYAAWLQLLAATHSASAAERAARENLDGSELMETIWVARMLELQSQSGQAADRAAWIAWARDKGLDIEPYLQLTERKTRPELAQLPPPQQAEMLLAWKKPSRALAISLSFLGDDTGQDYRDILTSQAYQINSAYPQGILFSWKRYNSGNEYLQGAGVQAARLLRNDWYLTMDLFRGEYGHTQAGYFPSGGQWSGTIEMQKALQNGSMSWALDASYQENGHRLGAGFSRNWNVTDYDNMGIDLLWHRENTASLNQRAYGYRSGLTIRGQHQLTSDDFFSWSGSQYFFNTLDDTALGDGQELNAQLSHSLSQAPFWQVKAGVLYQENHVDQDPGNPDEAEYSGMLQPRYGQVYLNTTLSQGLVGTFSPQGARLSWIVDLGTGWEWYDNALTYNANTGLGVPVFGHDQLSVTYGYQSSQIGHPGEASTVFNISYGVRFGR